MNKQKANKSHKAKIVSQEIELDYSHYKEPLTPVKDGYGFMGTLAFSKDGELVQCHECGEFFPRLSNHIRTHKMSAKDYKEKYQLSSRTGLISPNQRLKQQKEYIRYYAINKHKYKKGGEKGRKNRKKGQPKLSLEADNKRGTCPDQTKDKILRLADKLGKAPTPKEFRSEYNGSGGYESVIRHFGSWENAIIECGLVPRNKQIKPKYDDESLLYLLRKWYEKHGRTPLNSDFVGTDELPSPNTYRKRFGSMNDARRRAGIPEIIQIGYGKFREAKIIE